MEHMTVGQFKELLKGWPDDYEITFAGGLEFYRFKKRGDKLVNLEFNETVYRDSNGVWRVTPGAEG